MQNTTIESKQQQDQQHQIIRAQCKHNEKTKTTNNCNNIDFRRELVVLWRDSHIW